MPVWKKYGKSAFLENTLEKKPSLLISHLPNFWWFWVIIQESQQIDEHPVSYFMENFMWSLDFFCVQILSVTPKPIWLESSYPKSWWSSRSCAKLLVKMTTWWKLCSFIQRLSHSAYSFLRPWELQINMVREQYSLKKRILKNLYMVASMNTELHIPVSNNT